MILNSYILEDRREKEKTATVNKISKKREQQHCCTDSEFLPIWILSQGTLQSFLGEGRL